ncbi:MAG TPA: chemotaxis protein CheA [Clostridia bacterium]|nr:chemotaxis protein CheA [Clostridia bacterium]
MSSGIDNDSMVEIYIHETEQLVEQLETIIIEGEKTQDMTSGIPEIFRLMHTIKGNSMMMHYDNIAKLAHSAEDLFDYLRTEEPEEIDFKGIADLMLEAVDFIKHEVDKIQSGEEEFADAGVLIDALKDYLESLMFLNGNPEEEIKGGKEVSREEIIDDLNFSNDDRFYHVKIIFEEDCQMENVRAFSIVNGIGEFSKELHHNLMDFESDASEEFIRENGFEIVIGCEQNYKELENFFSRVSLLKDLELNEINKDEYISIAERLGCKTEKSEVNVQKKIIKADDKNEIEKVEKLNQTVKKRKYISVDVEKLDNLMNLVGEIVVSEAMVTGNPELQNLKLDNFNKAANQMRKIINDLQDIVMEIRMVPLSLTFQKMNRIVRDMCSKTGKNVSLELVGQETEVDKNIIEHISDPLMHLIRNSIDHGIEEPDSRIKQGKDVKGKVILEAKHSGGDVWITVKDDGQGLDREKILEKAYEKGFLERGNQYGDKEIFNMIFKPGFSTNEEITGFSGRGVGMDVVIRNIEKIGGAIRVESQEGQGSEFVIRIPLTLAIIDGMITRVGKSNFTLPIISIKESFKAQKKDIIRDTENHEMILVRGKCHPIIRLHERFELETDIIDIEDGILIMVGHDNKVACLFTDELVGEHQVVVKNFSRFLKKTEGLTGCALLGDGGISMILDPSGLIR